MVMENCDKSNDTSVRFYIICVTLDGLPIFSLTEGELPTLSFPVIGSLNAVHMFAKGSHVELGCTTVDGGKILWKEYGSIKLIIVNFSITCDSDLIYLLDSIYKCMVLILGAHEFSKIANIEKLKKKVKLCFPLIHNFVDHSKLLSNVTGVTDVLITGDSGLLQNYLNSYTEECQSEFGFLTFNQKVAVGTDKFWQLSPIETSLILHLLESLSPASAVDIPIYLPNGSPTVPHRLVSLCLLENVNVVLICGPHPSLQLVLHKYVKKYWVPVVHTLRSYSRLHPRGFPPEINLDSNLLAFILIGTCDRKNLTSLYPHGSVTGADQGFLADPHKRKTELISFYKSVNGSMFWKIKKVADHSTYPEVRETYVCMDKYKCYALRSKNHELYSLFANELPSYALGNISRQILKQLTKDKSL